MQNKKVKKKKVRSQQGISRDRKLREDSLHLLMTLKSHQVSSGINDSAKADELYLNYLEIMNVLYVNCSLLESWLEKLFVWHLELDKPPGVVSISHVLRSYLSSQFSLFWKTSQIIDIWPESRVFGQNTLNVDGESNF